MKKLDNLLIKMRTKAQNAVDSFMESERGDTNFVSMLLIIGIVVVIAGLFLGLLRETIWPKISESITKLLGEL